MPLDLIISLPGMFTKSILLSAPPVLEKDAVGILTITTVHKKSFPVRCLNVKLRVTGDDFAVNTQIICSGEADSRREITIDTSKTGLTKFEISRLLTISLIGLFSVRVKTESSASVLVLPPPIKPENTVALPRGFILRPKPGGGFSEEHDMRNYRQGDPVRSIHWKLSAKFDSLIIREPLAPPHHSRLVHIMPWENAIERDLILGRLLWIAEYLFKWELPFFVKLGEEAAIAEIAKETDLVDFLRYVLDIATDKTVISGTLPTRFTWVFRIDAGLVGAATPHSIEGSDG